jgi:hypothetical protein
MVAVNKTADQLNYLVVQPVIKPTIYWSMVGAYEHDNEPTVSIKDREIFI